MKMISCKLSIFLLVVFYATHSNSATECKRFTGQIIEPINFHDAFKAINPATPKDEFEKTASYKERLKNSSIPKQLIIKRNIHKTDNHSFISYDADAEELKIEAFAFDSPNFNIRNAEQNSIPKVSIPLGLHPIFLTPTDGSDIGAIININDVSNFMERNLINIFLGAIKSPPEEARKIKDHSSVAYVISPTEPYKSKSKWVSEQQNQKNISGNLIIASIDCLLWIDDTNKVLGSYTAK